MFGIVPLVDPSSTGAVSGIVGAGGNFGAIIGGLFLNPGTPNGISDGFRNLSFVVIASAFLATLLSWPQHGSMFRKPTTTDVRAVEFSKYGSMPGLSTS